MQRFSDSQPHTAHIGVDYYAAPFFLIFGAVAEVLHNATEFENMLHRMGLRPVLWDDTAAERNPVSGVVEYAIRLGDMQARIALHAPGALARDDAELLINAQFLGAETPSLDTVASSHFVRLSPGFTGDETDPRTIDMLRALCQIAYQCCVCLHPEYVFWSPAQIWSDAGEFAESVEEMFKSGMPPVRHMVGFVAPHAQGHDSHSDHPAADASEGRGVSPNPETSLISKGLSLFCGQEILAVAPFPISTAALSHAMIVLAIDMIVNGPIQEQKSFDIPEMGFRAHLIPTFYGRQNAGLVRMIIKSVP